jgi:hypothetical protein
MKLRWQRIDVGPVPQPATIPRMTLLGECFALLCMVIALLGEFRWGLTLPETVLALGQILATAWIFMRATGVLQVG